VKRVTAAGPPPIAATPKTVKEHPHSRHARRKGGGG
jgi:hypothetical protein